MPLANFGSILNFAEELEKQGEAFYAAALDNPDCAAHKDLFGQFAKDGKKNIKKAQRTRRENVTEMILEHIKGLSKEPFQDDVGDPMTMDAAQALAAARDMEDRVNRYYTTASEKIKAMPEISRALKTLGKKHAAHLKKLEGR
ncbi:MAG: hypothetical protein GY859_04665 [Desulfobacterales bacterium]|nr:hypothetical protein [Desulfobacterales bacterium]